jgi:hypothetical protein
MMVQGHPDALGCLCEPGGLEPGLFAEVLNSLFDRLKIASVDTHIILTTVEKVL